MRSGDVIHPLLPYVGLGTRLGCHTAHAYGVSLLKGRFRCKIRLKLSFLSRAKAIKEEIALTAWLEQLLLSCRRVVDTAL